MITIDTSGFLALLDQKDPNHRAAIAELRRSRGPLILPTGILAEIAYFLERRHGAVSLSKLLRDLEDRRYIADCGEADFARVRFLVERYADMPLGYADAAVIACAERNGGKVLTLDLRHFGVVAREGSITLLP